MSSAHSHGLVSNKKNPTSNGATPSHSVSVPAMPVTVKQETKTIMPSKVVAGSGCERIAFGCESNSIILEM